ncbi:MAG: prolyl oligopeptidase family serine peptidase [Anaerolineaceae bacterium]|nr:prolyl oligopeptidase family serine peptidase [Anaerolineaceae bacterium]
MSDANVERLIEAMLDMPHYSEVQLSPDGRTIAFVLGKANKADQNTPIEKSIYLMDVATRKQRPLADAPSTTNDLPRWSPDGKKLTFLTNRADFSEMQLCCADLQTGEIQALTDLRGSVDGPQWLSDGSGITFLYDGNLDKDKQPEPDPLVIDANPPFKRIWLLDLERRDLRLLSPESCHVFEYALSPDGSKLAFLKSAHLNPHEGWYSAQLYVLNIKSGDVRPICTMPHQMGRFTWSPDGAAIAFVSCVMSDEGSIAGDVYTISALGGKARCLTPNLDHTVMWIDWRDEGILYGARHIESTLIGWIDPQSGSTETISKGLVTIGEHTQRVHAINKRTFAAVRESFDEPSNVYLGSLDGGEWQRLTDISVDSNLMPPLQVDNKEWEGKDGKPVQGFLVYPPNYEAGKRYPLFIHVHGGPSLSYSPRYVNSWERLITSRGCLVLMPNPRGSWGRGAAYQSANVGDLGGGDWQDINAGIDCLVDEGLADPERLAIGGWSYGGYLVTWAVTQTDRFRCAIAGASITNYESNYGVVKNREWQTTLFGSMVYDDIELHRSRSPMTHVKKVKTPTLLVHGERDILAPTEQSIEFYVALKHFNVPTQLVIYPREPHGFQERAHQRDLYQRIVSWIDRYLLNP